MALVLAFRPRGLFVPPSAKRYELDPVPAHRLALQGAGRAGPVPAHAHRLGLVGQGLYYALGAYAAGVARTSSGVRRGPMVLAGSLVAAAFAAVLGLLLAR